MSKILVVEPHRMLQQAIALALFPEHEVKIVSAIPESSALKDFDAVIFDLKSLGESAGGAEAAVRAVQSWKVPTVWVQGSSHEPTPQRENLIPIIAPIEKDVLLSALAECLGIISKEKRLDKTTGSSRARDNQGDAAASDPSTRAPALAGDSRSGFRPTGVPEGATSSPVGIHKAAGSSKAKDNQGGAAAPAGDPEVIELLDVVEETSEAEIQQAGPKK